MYIFNKSVQRVGRIYEQNKVVKPNKKTTENKDKVTLSDEGKELQATLQKVYTAQKPRAKAETLKEEIRAGTYNIKGKEVAASIIRHFKQGY